MKGPALSWPFTHGFHNDVDSWVLNRLQIALLMTSPRITPLVTLCTNIDALLITP